MRTYTLNGSRQRTPNYMAGSTFATGVGIVADTQAPGSGSFVQGFIDGVINLLGGGPSRWLDTPAGSEVHDWFHYGPNGNQAFQDWLDAKYPDVFGSLDAVLALAPAFLAETWDVFITPTNDYSAWYRPGVTEQGYRGMGIDIAATIDASTPGQRPVWVKELNPGPRGGGRGGGAGVDADGGGDAPPDPPEAEKSSAVPVLIGLGILFAIAKS